MHATMFHLKSFVYHRLYVAAEEILGEVEKTISSALYESKEEVESLEHPLYLVRKKPATVVPLISSNPEHGDRCGAPPTQENPGLSTPEESHFSVSAGLPGSSQNCAGYWPADSDFTMNERKGEQEELLDESETQISLPSFEMVKSEQAQSETDISLNYSAEQSDNSDREQTNTTKREEKMLQGQCEIDDNKEQAALSHGDCSTKDRRSTKGVKDRSFCHFCGKGFHYIGSLMKHIKTHEDITNCTVCGRRHNSAKQLVTHLKKCHKNTVFCEICGKTLPSNNCLKVHLKIHSSSDTFVCQECGRIFNRRDHLIVHVRTHSGEKPYHCDICGKAFSQSQNLTLHKRSHSGERPHVCSLCGKLFSLSSHLKAHMRYHSGVKLYSCDICGKEFYQRGQMTRHRTTHAGERPYACHICGMRYRFAPNLKVHLQTHERSATQPSHRL